MLVVASLLVHSGAWGGPGRHKQLVAVFGDDATLDRALLVWWLFGGLLVASLLTVSRRPLTALVLAGLGGAGHLFDARFGVQPLDLAVPMVLFVVASTARARWVSGVALAVFATGGYLIGLWNVLQPGNKTAIAGQLLPASAGALTAAAGRSLPVVLVLGLAVAVGDSARSRRRALDVLRQRADDLERDQRQRAALATAAERARISRELHDIVGHGLSVIVAQAQGAAAVLERHPERSAVALRHVIDTGRGALADMRRVLGVLGGDDVQVTAPGVAALPDLVDRVGSAGLRVRLRVEGEPHPLPSDVDLSVHRIVQEALTNTVKHAGPGAEVTVLLRFTARGVEVDIHDAGGTNGAGPTVGGGHGLRGIAERVDLLGGELDAGPAEHGGFRVRALLPVGAGR